MSKAARFLFWPLLSLAVFEFSNFLIVRFVFPKPFVREGSFLKVNSNYGFYDFRFETDRAKISLKKGEGVLRVFSFGASTTAGWPWGEELSYTSRLAGHLSELYPKDKIEVVNLSVSGFDSREILHAVSDSLSYHPDLILVYMGHNTIEEYNLKKLKAGLFNPVFCMLDETFSFRVINHLANVWMSGVFYEKTVLPASTRGRIFEEPILSASEKQSLVKNYGKNLNRMIALCRRNKIRLALIEPIFNMQGRGPVYSHFSSFLTKADRERFEGTLKKGIFLFKQANFKEALSYFQDCLAIDDSVAILHYYMANTYYRLNDLDKAIFHRRKSTDLDGLLAVYPESYLRILKKVEERADLTVVSIFDAIQQANGDSFLGREWIIDDIHPTLQAHQRIADILFHQLAEKGWISKTPDWNLPSPGEGDLQEEMGEKSYPDFAFSFARYLWHLSFWTFESEEMLQEARALVKEYLAHIGSRGGGGRIP